MWLVVKVIATDTKEGEIASVPQILCQDRREEQMRALFGFEGAAFKLRSDMIATRFKLTNQ